MKCICDEFCCLDSRFVEVHKPDECRHCRRLTVQEPCPAIPGSGVPGRSRRIAALRAAVKPTRTYQPSKETNA